MSTKQPKVQMEDFRVAAAHSEGQADGERLVRDLVAAQIEGLEDRMAAALVRDGWSPSDAKAAAWLIMPVIRDTVGSV